MSTSYPERPLPRVRRPWAALVSRLERVPLRDRLLAILFLLIAIALIATASVSGVLLDRDLHRRVDDELRAAAAPVAQQGWADLAPEAKRVPTAYAVVFFSGDGQRTALWPQGERTRPALPVVTAEQVRARGSEPFTVPSTDGRTRWRMIAGTISGGPGTFVVGVPLEDTERTVRRLVVLVLLIGTGTLLTSVLIGFFAIHRAFRPLRQIEDTAAAIAGGDLSRRIPHRDSGDEVASLADSLNVMLSQIESAFARSEASEFRMRQFVADASHELRTPLATVKGYAELYRQGAVGTRGDLDQAMERIEGESTRMTHLVDDMLLLARLDTQRPLELGEVDLVVLAADAVQDARAREPSRQVSLCPLEEQLQGITVTGDDSRLRQVVTNLVNNALMHTPEGTPVEVAVGRRDGWAVIEVRDHGRGIPPEVAERVFERFYREDKARSRSKGGSGLGLAIVAVIVDQHGGSVRVTQTPGGGATFTVALPTAPAQVRSSQR